MNTTTAQLADSQRPWIGLASFTEGDREFFAGRGEEIDELLRLVRRDTLTLLYGVSGLGKTSLLQAGLFPALRLEDCLPVPIRLDYLEGAPPLAAQVLAAISAAASVARVEAPQPRADETLWEYFHHENHHFWSLRNDLVTPFLVFDQFEEFFTLGRETPERAQRASAFISELAGLVENRPPTSLRDDPQRAGEFNFKPVPLKVLLAMREDYLADLDRIRSQFRALGQSRLRLLPMDERQARQVIDLGAKLLAPGVEDRIVEFVAGGEANTAVAEITVAPALLSLMLQELNERRLARGPDAKITSDLLDLEQQKILEDFYLRTLKDFPESVRTFIEDRLLTATGYRNSCALDDAVSCPDVTKARINELVNRRLLAYEDRHHTRRVELSHDVLIPVIKASRDSRQKRKADKDRQKALLERSRARAISLTMFVLAFFAVIAAVVAIKKSRLANHLAEVAREEEEVAKRRESEAYEQALGRRFASQAEAILNSPREQVEVGVLYAVESMRLYPTQEGDHALRLGLGLMPRTVGSPIAASGISDVALTSGGRYLIAADTNRLVRVWNVTNTTKIATLTNQDAEIRCVSVSPDDRFLVVATDSNVNVWTNWWSDHCPEPLQIPFRANTLAFDKQSQHLAIGGDGEHENIFVIDLESPGIALPRMSHSDHAGTNSVAYLSFSPLDGYLVSCGAKTRVWRWRQGTNVADFPYSPLPPAFDERGRKLFLASGREIHPWESWNSAKNPKDHLEQAGRILMISPHSRFLVTEGPRIWESWDEGRGREIARFNDGARIRFSHDDDWFVVYSATNLQVYKARGHQEVARIADVRQFEFCRFTRDGKFLGAFGGRSLSIFDLTKATNLISLRVSTFAFSPSGEHLAVSDDSKTKILRGWQESKPVEVASVAVKQAQALAFTGKGDCLATMTNGVVLLWTLPLLDRPREVARLPADGSGRGIIAFSEDGSYMTASLGISTRVWGNWRAGNAKEIARVPREKEEEDGFDELEVGDLLFGGGISLSAHGTYFAKVDRKHRVSRLRVFKLVGNTVEIPPIPFRGEAGDVALGPDGKFAAVGGTDGSVQLWDVDSGERGISIKAGLGNVKSVQFSPDGRYLSAWTYGDSTLRVLSLRTNDLIAEAHDRVRQNLTTNDWNLCIPPKLLEKNPYHKTFPDLP